MYVHSMQLDRIKNPLKIKKVSFEKSFIIYSTDLSEVWGLGLDSEVSVSPSNLTSGLGLKRCGLDYNTGTYSDNCEEVPIRGTCTRKSLEATRLPPSSFAGSERASSSEVRAVSSGVERYHFVYKIPRDQCLARSVHA